MNNTIENQTDLTVTFAEELAAVIHEIPPGPMALFGEEMGRGAGAVLYVLWFNERGITPGEIAQELGFTSNRVANILKRLYEKGFVAVAQDPLDRRRRLIILTREGRDFGLKAKERIDEAGKRLFACLGEHDAMELLRILKKICDYEKKGEKDVQAI